MPKRVTEVSSADLETVVSIVCTAIDNAREHVTSEASWERLTEFFYQKLVHERDSMSVLWSIQLVAWAEAGHPAAHRALRRYGREMKERSRFDDIMVTVRAFLIRTDDQPFVPFPQGRHVVQHLMRDLWLPRLVQHVAEGTGLPPTRTRGTQAPSAAYFIALGMKRKGLKLSEREINRIYWRRHTLPARIEASMPPLVEWRG